MASATGYANFGIIFDTVFTNLCLQHASMYCEISHKVQVLFMLNMPKKHNITKT